MTSIYEQIGGREAVAATVDIGYELMLADPLLAPYFTGTPMHRLKAHVRKFVAAALGGPEIYRGKDMHAAHAHLGITGEAFDRAIDHLVRAMQRLSVPAHLIEAIGAKLSPLRAQIVAVGEAAA
jgi:hemoglobin